MGLHVLELIIFPIYSALRSDMQTRFFKPAPLDSRKVVIVTNIAKTSLTDDGLYFVVNPDFVKQKVHNSKTGMASLIKNRQPGEPGGLGWQDAIDCTLRGRKSSGRIWQRQFCSWRLPTSTICCTLTSWITGRGALMMAPESLHSLSALDKDGMLMTRLPWCWASWTEGQT